MHRVIVALRIRTARLAEANPETDFRIGMTLPKLSLLHTRVLGVLVEKQHTVPDTYPLTLHALTAGCNQKTSRDPILDAAEVEVQSALDDLKRLSLAIESSGGRTMRYAQNIGRVLEIPPQAVALIAVLMLRGPQTAGELRLNAERLHRFADISSVEAFLQELSRRAAGPLVVELPRQAGSREPRWAHLLSEPPSVVQTPASASAAPSSDSTTVMREIAGLRADIARLHEQLAELKATVARLTQGGGDTDA